jgi:hypothetical protein
LVAGVEASGNVDVDLACVAVDVIARHNHPSGLGRRSMLEYVAVLAANDLLLLLLFTLEHVFKLPVFNL